MLYHSLIYSRLKYGILAWGCANETTLYPLNILHNKILRCLLSVESKRLCINSLYLQSNLLKLNDIYLCEVAKFMFRFENNLLPPIFHKYFLKLSDVHTHSTHSVARRVYFTPQCTSLISKRSLKFEGIEVWEKIPHDLKDSSPATFNRLLKKHILDGYEQ